MRFLAAAARPFFVFVVAASSSDQTETNNKKKKKKSPRCPSELTALVWFCVPIEEAASSCGHLPSAARGFAARHDA